MIGYKHQITWLLHSSKQASKLVDVLGAKSLDWVEAKSRDMKTIERYDSMVQFPYGLADKELKKWLRKSEKHKDFYAFDFIRKY